MRKNILLLEDDLNLSKPLVKHLHENGYDAKTYSSLGALKNIQFNAFDALVFDWNLPDGQSIDLIKKLRSDGYRNPIILLTARVEVMDKVLGLELGANDYITKPFDPRELVARLNVQLRETNQGDKKPIVIQDGPIEINLETRTILFKGNECDFGRLEFELVKLLVQNPGKVFTRNELLEIVWGYEEKKTTRTVDAHMAQVRAKTDESLFETLRGVGYRYKSAG